MWLRRFHDAAPGAPVLLCFPHAGGAATFYAPLSAALAPAVRVVAVQYPGRQDRLGESCITELSDLVDGVLGDAAGLARRCAAAGRPFGLFGHSMGAVVAYEVGLRLERDGAGRLDRVFVSARWAPSLARPGSVHRSDDGALVAELAALNGTDLALLDDPELRGLILPAVRADYQAIETYRPVPGQTLAAPVTALAGAADPRLTGAEARGWAAHTRGGFDLRIFPGDHFYLTPQRAAVARLVTDSLTGFTVRTT